MPILYISALFTIEGIYDALSRLRLDGVGYRFGQCLWLSVTRYRSLP
jgi:hypothetical protein